MERLASLSLVDCGMPEMSSQFVADAEMAAKDGPFSALRELRKLGLRWRWRKALAGMDNSQ